MLLSTIVPAREQLVEIIITSMISSDVYQRLKDHVVEIRRRVCPRTSYATSGSAASVIYAFVLRDESHTVPHDEAYSGGGTKTHSQQMPLSSFQPLAALLTESDEFDEVHLVSSLDELEGRVKGNVVLMFGALHSRAVASAETLFSKGQTKLVVFISLTDNNNLASSNNVANGIRLSTVFDLGNFTVSEHLFESSVPSICIAACHSYKLKIPDTGVASSQLKGFNGQPSVLSMRQFDFLWNHASSMECKERVLQRLADREVKPKTTVDRKANKYSRQQWDDIVMKALHAGENDYRIYDLIRQHVLGSSLAVDLCTGRQVAIPSAEGGSDGRADFMVKVALDCIPSKTRLRLKQSGRYMLDYGCAEGSITASLGRALEMKPECVLGADIRSIPSEGFRFLQLPAEDPSHPPALRSILPSLRDNSIEFVTASMVFHHVTHIEAVLQELRRIITDDGVLLIREHHCTSPEMAAFLDITHGLYSLSWSDPVEWPDFVDEYKAYYRSQTEWDALLSRAGFALSLHLEGSQTAVSYRKVQSDKRKPDGSYPNVIKAYYAAYQPVPVKTTAIHAQLPMKRPVQSAIDVDDMSGGVRESKSMPEGVPDLPEELFESKKYPGRFYKVNKETGATEWIA